MKICLAQYDIKWEDKATNYEKAKGFMADAKLQNVDLILFPELSMTGFSMDTEKIGESPGGLRTLETFRGFALEFGMACGIGYVFLRNGGKAENRYAIISKDGSVISDYAKIHPFSNGGEDAYYVGGDAISECMIDDVCVSTFICYDLRFPEIFQAASRKAQLITVAANWPAARKEHWVTLLKARAIENQCYIAGINRVGTGNGIAYSGDSMIVDPTGRVIAEAGNGEMLIEGEIDIEKVDRCRESFRIRDDRREDLYREL